MDADPQVPRARGSSLADPLTPDETLQVVIGVVLVDALWRFLGLFPNYGFTFGYWADLLCRVSQIAVILAMSLRFFRKGPGAIGLPTGRWPADLAVGLFAAALCGVAVLGVRWTVAAGGGGDLFDLLGMRGGSARDRIRWLALLRAGVGPLAEDLFFWGVLYHALRGRLPFAKAAAYVGLPFVLLHWSPGAGWQALAEPACGVLLFVPLFEWRRSILSTLPVHVLANLAILLISRGVVFPG